MSRSNLTSNNSVFFETNKEPYSRVIGLNLTLSWLQTNKLSLQLSASDGSKAIKICLKRASTRTDLLLRPMRKHQAVTKMIVFFYKRSSFNLVSTLIYICIA